MLTLTAPGFLFEREKLTQVGNYQQNKSVQSSSYKVALVFNHPQQQLPPVLKEMTEKLIAACRFKPGEAIYVNQNEANSFSLNELTSNPNIKLILAFGNIRLSRNMGNLTKQRAYQFGDVKIIQTDTPENLDKNGASKKELWATLTAALNLK